MQIKNWCVVRRNTPIVVALFTGFVLGLGVLMSLAGCTPNQESQLVLQEQQEKSDEETIRQGIEAELDALAHPTQEQLSTHLGSSDAEALATLEQFGINYQELIQHLLGRMSYSVDEVTVEGDHAQAKLTINNVNIDEALGNLGATLDDSQSIEEFGAHFEAQDDAAIMQAIMQRAYACIDESQEMVSSQVALAFNKEDDTWRVDESGLYSLVHAVYGGFDFSALGI